MTDAFDMPKTAVMIIRKQMETENQMLQCEYFSTTGTQFSNDVISHNVRDVISHNVALGRNFLPVAPFPTLRGRAVAREVQP